MTLLRPLIAGTRRRFNGERFLGPYGTDANSCMPSTRVARSGNRRR